MIAKHYTDIEDFQLHVNGRCEDCKKRFRIDKLACVATRKSYRKTGLDLLCLDCTWKRAMAK